MGVDTGTDVGTTEVTVGIHEIDCATVLALIWLVTAAELSMRPCVDVEIWPEIGAQKLNPAVE